MRKPTYAARGSKVVESDEWVQFLSVLSKDMFFALNPGMAGLSNIQGYNVKRLTGAMDYIVQPDDFVIFCSVPTGVLRLRLPKAKEKMALLVYNHNSGGTVAITPLGTDTIGTGGEVTVSNNSMMLILSNGDTVWMKMT
jgi:hypothetical protein